MYLMQWHSLHKHMGLIVQPLKLDFIAYFLYILATSLGL